MRIYVVSSENSRNILHENVISHHATLRGAYHDVKDLINFLKGFDDGIKDIMFITKYDIAGCACHMWGCSIKENEYDYVTFSILEKELGP